MTFVQAPSLSFCPCFSCAFQAQQRRANHRLSAITLDAVPAAYVGTGGTRVVPAALSPASLLSRSNCQRVAPAWPPFPLVSPTFHGLNLDLREGSARVLPATQPESDPCEEGWLHVSALLLSLGIFLGTSVATVAFSVAAHFRVQVLAEKGGQVAW